MNYSIQTIEEAIIFILSGLSKSNGGKINTLKVYSGQFDEGAVKGNQSLILCPAVLVRYVESIYDPDGGPSFERKLRFALYHASSNMESERKRRGEVCDLLDSTRAKLNNSDLGLVITPMTIEKETAVSVTKNMTVFGAFYILGFQEDTSQYQA